MSDDSDNIDISKTKPDPIPYTEWLERFCNKYNELNKERSIDPKKVINGFFFRKLYETGNLPFVENENFQQTHNTPEEACINFLLYIFFENYK